MFLEALTGRADIEFTHKRVIKELIKRAGAEGLVKVKHDDSYEADFRKEQADWLPAQGQEEVCHPQGHR